MRRFETLIDAISSNRGDAIIASLAVTPQMRARLDFTDPYYRAPARFVSRRDAVIPEIAGDAYICGFANWIIDERDPLTYGFLVR